ncbi:hypothetical protein NZD89_01175 [Alicyclobacillus fastidiosus]|uniref:Uncharacterized protein n=1 Tax=Alicyclobacillus fastidiosus TaxID=392011 RepID=A0ABY6ZGY0_9BACL|nr:hypothetical protein [Alicyclobacillus fastidiosus]WAH42158.1 hypothetical protein NZD89_01175 [Alicyclobacillus fastidiosus]GMA63950.1 hypothetical protein GCM10025859_43900 [Alicyclobacillus fastidiosus]
MVVFHMIYGFLLILLDIVVTIWEITSRNGAPRGLRGAAIGLMDLQIIIGIITWITARPAPSFVWHPIFMVVAIIIAHIFTASRRKKASRVTGWVVTDVLLILGASLFHG